MLVKPRAVALKRKGSCLGLLSLVLVVWAPALHAQGEKQTVIHVSVDEKHDRLTPDIERDIEWVHEFTVTLSGKNAVSEVQKNTFAGSSQHPATPKRQAHLMSENERQAALGQNGGKVVWQVLGPKKLRRIGVQGQSIAIFDIDIDGGNNCHITVRYLQQTGFSDTIGIRAGTGTIEHFTLARLVSASCSIEAS
jgi:hypothetical protein